MCIDVECFLIAYIYISVFLIYFFFFFNLKKQLLLGAIEFSYIEIIFLLLLAKCYFFNIILFRNLPSHQAIPNQHS